MADCQLCEEPGEWRRGKEINLRRPCFRAIRYLQLNRLHYHVLAMHAKRISLLLTFALMLLPISAAARRRHRSSTEGVPGSFDYYLLSLSWAPNFCASHPGDGSSECRHGRHTGFVLHGLWPQANDGPFPQDCAAASPVSRQIVTHMLSFYPTEGLIQHEWARHGTCSGLSSTDYFAKAEQAFRAVQAPERYRNLAKPHQFSVEDIERDFAGASHAPRGSFRISCHAGELVAVEACFSKELRFQACSESARECPASQVLVRPPQ